MGIRDREERKWNDHKNVRYKKGGGGGGGGGGGTGGFSEIVRITADIKEDYGTGWLVASPGHVL